MYLEATPEYLLGLLIANVSLVFFSKTEGNVTVELLTVAFLGYLILLVSIFSLEARKSSIAPLTISLDSPVAFITGSISLFL